MWEQGASSERIVGARLDRIDGIEVLHDRQVPGTRAGIDHIAIGPGGVYVIGTSSPAAPSIESTVAPRFVRRDRRLVIGGQDQTKLIARIGNQVDAITRVLRETPIPVTAGLCIVEGQWPVGTRPFMWHGVWVGWPDALPELVTQAGFLDSEAMKTAAAMLDARLPRS